MRVRSLIAAAATAAERLPRTAGMVTSGSFLAAVVVAGTFHVRLLVGAGAVDPIRAGKACRLFDEVRAMTWRLLHPQL